ncbi:MAG: hypothetical protein DRN25_00105 [Thermoplasmata archaeon]|nr:MAG: hypothetical protein DRN25_00105 [Thermoplasmata archaeon]
MLASHMDEIGLMVKHIDKQGFIRFTTLGGLEEDIAILEKKQRFLHSFFYEGMGTDFSLREI